MASLDTLARGKGPYSPKQLKQVYQWVEDDWESHDHDKQVINIIWRLLHTIKHLQEKK